MPAVFATVAVFFLALAIDTGTTPVRERDQLVHIVVSLIMLVIALPFAWLAWHFAH